MILRNFLIHVGIHITFQISRIFAFDNHQLSSGYSSSKSVWLQKSICWHFIIFLSNFFIVIQLMSPNILNINWRNGIFRYSKRQTTINQFRLSFSCFAIYIDININLFSMGSLQRHNSEHYHHLRWSFFAQSFFSAKHSNLDV